MFLLRAALTAACVAWPCAAFAVDPPFNPKAHQAVVLPLLQKYCVRCHGEKEQEAAVRVDALPPTFKSNTYEATTWADVLDQVSQGTMPPPKEKLRPTADEVEKIREWIRGAQRQAVASSQDGAGQVVLRRLNRAEYDNTIRDCFGIDLKLARGFPTDDRDAGFDNIGRALTISHTLMDQYVAAAETIVERAFASGPPPKKMVIRSDPEHGALLSGGGGPSTGPVHNEFHRLRSGVGRAGGGLQFPFTLKEPGLYRATLRVAAWPVPPAKAVRLELRLGTEFAAGREVKADEYTGEIVTFEKVFSPRDVKETPKQSLAVAAAGGGDLLLDYVVIEGPVFDSWPSPAFHACFPDGKTAGDETDMRRIVQTFGARIYRRPLSEQEIAPLAAVYKYERTADADHLTAMRSVFKRMLVSPQFLFLLEPNAAAKARPLNDYELANRLSYFLWSTTPDEPLFAAAQAGRLRDKAELSKQVARMLAHPRRQAFIDNMTGQWLSLRDIDAFDVDPKQFPSWDKHLRESMLGETKAFFQEILDHDLSTLNFLDSDWAMLNERLAKHYGIAGVEGDELRRVKLPPGSHRGGLITQASMMKILSDGIETKPIKRAAWILENLLADPPPPPPPMVASLVPNKSGQAPRTLRERLVQHRVAAACISCHRKIDPLGFGLENYDAIGAWRETEGKVGRIDASGTLPSGAAFSGPDEMKRALLARKHDFCRCITEKFLTYALGRRLEFTDHDLVESIAAKMPAHGYTMKGLILDIVRSDAFRHR